MDYEQLRGRFYSKAVLAPGGFFSIVHQGLIKDEVEFASFIDMISIWKILKSLPLNFLNAVIPL